MIFCSFGIICICREVNKVVSSKMFIKISKQILKRHIFHQKFVFVKDKGDLWNLVFKKLKSFFVCKFIKLVHLVWFCFNYLIKIVNKFSLQKNEIWKQKVVMIFGLKFKKINKFDFFGLKLKSEVFLFYVKFLW